MELPTLVSSTLEINQKIGTLTFERHDVLNILTGTGLIEDIVNAVNWANRSTEINVLIMTGRGSAFSAGGDLKQMRDQQETFGGSIEEIAEKYRHGIQQVPKVIHSAEIPIIAAINGPAIGAGFDLCCMCDFRIGSSEAIFGETFVKLGVVSGDGGAWFLQRLIGYQKAAELILTGRLVKADEAKELGILLDVVEPENLMDRARELALQIAKNAPHAIRYNKRLLKIAQREELTDFLDMCACFQGISHHKKEHLEAVNAFLEKRAPDFDNR